MNILPNFKIKLINKLAKYKLTKLVNPIIWAIDILLGFFTIFVIVGIVYLSLKLWILIV